MTDLFIVLTVVFLCMNTILFLINWTLKWAVLYINWKRSKSLQLVGSAHESAVLPTNRNLLQCKTIFFSVHLPTHNEPPNVVINTIKSILESDYQNFELLVIDNNTSDVDLWMPVYEYCQKENNPKLRFYHFVDVKNAKAGALDIAFNLRNIEATHVVVVDADYTVQTDFLSRASTQLSRYQYDYLQFPQSYRGLGAHGLKKELGLYFSTISIAADAANTMLLTGTLSVISVEALTNLGGWNTTTLTEDAEIGLQLYMHGFRGRYIGEAAGTGLLPFTFADLERQRTRWIHGNFQVLTRYFFNIMEVNKTHLLAILCQLSAWFAYLLVPMVYLLLIPLIASYYPLPQIAASGMTIAAATIIFDFLARFFFIWLSNVRTAFNAVMNAFIVSWSLAGTSSLATYTANFPVAKTFNRTNKNITEATTSTSKSRTTHVIALLGLIIIIEGLQLNLPSICVAGFLMLLMLPFQITVSRQLRHYCNLLHNGSMS